MGPFCVVGLLLLLVRAEGRAFDPCNCEDLGGPVLEFADGFTHDRTGSDTSTEKFQDDLIPLNSGTQSELNQMDENSVGSVVSIDETSGGDGNYDPEKTDALVRRSEREAAKDSGASANKTAIPEVANVETSTPVATPTGKNSGTVIEKPENFPATNAATDKSAGNDKTETPNEPNHSSDDMTRDGSTSTTEHSAKNVNAGNENLETPSSISEAESATTKSTIPNVESSTKPQCRTHYTWDDLFKQCVYDPYNVPEANYDKFGNIDANAGNMQQIVTTEPASTTTVKHDCPVDQKWDELLHDCYFEPHLQPPAITDSYGDVFANAG